MLKRLFSFCVLLLLVAAGFAAWLIFSPYANRSAQSFIQIERGMSSQRIAEELSSEGVIRRTELFLLVRAMRFRDRLQAGEYRFGPSQSPWEVFERIHRGDIYYESVTIPEGSNIFDIAEILTSGGLAAAPGFLEAAHDGAVVHDLDPRAQTLEGYLFPSTYRITRKTSAGELCRQMTAEFRKQWSQLGSSNDDAHRVVTLASLIEKETALPDERPIVAAVYLNRLRRGGMLLQCDPTVVYASLLANRYRGTIYKSDLGSDSPYNTYRFPGLPPGPIANPGRTSLRAALHPAESSYLYFVAKPHGNGAHQFSATLPEHERAVAAYRAGR